MVACWILVCAFLNCVGWILSACHALNRTGYAIAFTLATVVVLAWRSRAGDRRLFRMPWGKLRRRFRRPFPLAFLVLAGLAFLGGVLHAPSNYDGLTYRTPRVLHWLAAEQWHWVATDFPRLNVRATGYEWVTAPIIAFTRTDRFTFLINTACFLMLPGLVFSLLYRLGVRRRVAWHWMWILPTGYTYLLQAGSIANDLFSAVFGLAAINFALRARASHRINDVFLSLLAAALVTGAKSTNLPIGLPWLLALWPALGVIRRHRASSVAVGAVALVVSLVPISILNIRYCGDWSGQALEHSAFGGVPALRLAANTVGFTLQNFVPPIFPLAGQWNQWVTQALPSGFAELMRRNFEPVAARFSLGEMQTEEGAGLGFGVCLLLLVSVGAAWRVSRPGPPSARRPSYQWLVPLGAWVAVVLFMAQSGLSGAVRYLAPYNVLLVAPFLVGAGQLTLVKSGWWRKTCGAVFALAALLLLVNPARPLWPAVTSLRVLGAETSPHPLVRRAWQVYSVYDLRADAFAPARAILPADANPLGFMSFDDPETSLWRPFESRRILHVRRSETSADLRRRGIKYVLTRSVTLANHPPSSAVAWLTQVEGEVVARVDLNLRASTGPKEWCLVKIR